MSQRALLLQVTAWLLVCVLSGACLWQQLRLREDARLLRVYAAVIMAQP